MQSQSRSRGTSTATPCEGIQAAYTLHSWVLCVWYQLKSSCDIPRFVLQVETLPFADQHCR
jgi:hypothetical protein